MYRPTEAHVIETLSKDGVELINYPSAQLKGMRAIHMIRADGASALAFSMGNVRALRRQGFLVDTVQLRKEVLV